MMVFISDVAEAVKSGKSDEELSAIICDFIGPNGNINAWRVEHYRDLRRWAYPDISECLDALVKINSDDDPMRAAGEMQLHDYVEHCLAVKSRFPKV